MLSVIIPTLNSEGELPMLLSQLVPAAVDGLVRDVIVVDGGSTDATLAICEDAGVEVSRSLGEAARLARSERVLVLPVAMRLPRDWDMRLGAHLPRGGDARLRGQGGRWFRPGPTGWLLTRQVLATLETVGQIERRGRMAARL